LNTGIDACVVLACVEELDEQAERRVIYVVTQL
jgi:hypothetical protein